MANEAGYYLAFDWAPEDPNPGHVFEHPEVGAVLEWRSPPEHGCPTRLEPGRCYRPRGKQELQSPRYETEAEALAAGEELDAEDEREHGTTSVGWVVVRVT